MPSIAFGAFPPFSMLANLLSSIHSNL